MLHFNYCSILNKYNYENNTDILLSADFKTYFKNFQKISE
nr:MAG TPA: hypothetical protein [Caudoviricetes sp.]DAR80092.1 MAG TPA: hypothetical protein [Caudoviricetes sp.]